MIWDIVFFVTVFLMGLLSLGVLAGKVVLERIIPLLFILFAVATGIVVTESLERKKAVVTPTVYMVPCKKVPDGESE